jgi:hypothetical protein
MRKPDTKLKAEIWQEFVDGGSISNETANNEISPKIEVTQIGTSVTNRLAMREGLPVLYLDLRIHNRSGSSVFLGELAVRSSWGKYFEIPYFSSEQRRRHEAPLPIEVLLNNATSEGIRLSAHEWIDGVLLARTAGLFPESALDSTKLEFIVEVESDSIVTEHSFLVDNFISPASKGGLIGRPKKPRHAGSDSISRQHDGL